MLDEEVIFTRIRKYLTEATFLKIFPSLLELSKLRKMQMRHTTFSFNPIEKEYLRCVLRDENFILHTFLLGLCGEDLRLRAFNRCNRLIVAKDVVFSVKLNPPLGALATAFVSGNVTSPRLSPVLCTVLKLLLS